MWSLRRAVLGRLSEHLFRDLGLDDASRSVLSDHAKRGPLVFVLRGVSTVDALGLAEALRRAGLPRLGYVQDVPWLSESRGDLPSSGSEAAEGVQPASMLEALARGRSAVLFLGRDRGLFSPSSGRVDGNELLRVLLRHAQSSGQAITLVPVTLLWTRAPGRLAPSPIDALFGPTDTPGDLRAMAQLAVAHDRGAVLVGEPLELQRFLAEEGPGSDEETRIRRLAYVLLRRVDREKRAALGPRRKSRPRLCDEVMRSKKLARRLDDLAKGDPAERAQLEQRARATLEQIAAAPDPEMLRALDPVAARLVRRVYSRIDVDPRGVERLREAARRGNVVLVPSHKSHVDYLVLSWALRKHMLELPLVAAGENLAFFPVGELLRRGGAFFIRRGSKADRVYAAVVDAYLRRLLVDGWPIELYFEGGRSRTGKLLPPMLGLLNLLVEAACSAVERPVSFVPVSISYERIMEDFELSREKAGAAKRRESARSLLAVADALSYDYGAVNIGFGEPIELGAVLRELGLERSALSPAKRRATTSRIALELTRGILRAAPVTAGGLVAMALLDMQRRGIAKEELHGMCRRLYVVAARRGAEAAPGLLDTTGRVASASIDDAIGVFVRGGLVVRHVPDDGIERPGELRLPGEVAALSGDDEVVYTVPDEARSRLDLTKNQILHHFAFDSAVALAFLGARRRSVRRADVLSSATWLATLARRDLVVFDDPDLDSALASALDALVASGDLSESDGELRVGPGSHDLDASTSLAMHASHLSTWLESTRIAARSLRALGAGVVEPQAEVVARALRIGRQMFLGGSLDRREAASAPTVSATLDAFVDEGLLVRSQAGLSLGPERSEASVRELEARLAGLMPRAARTASFMLAVLALLALTMVGCIGSPSALAPGLRGSVGLPHRGVLTHGVPLPKRGEGYERLRDDGTHWGHPGLVAMIEAAARDVARARPGSPALVVGDLSLRHGGKATRHRSHRTGRDVDLLLYATTPSGRPVKSPGFVRFGRDGLAELGKNAKGYVRFDTARTWLLVRAMVASPHADVQWIFVSKPLEALVVEYALALGEDPELVWHAENVMLQPSDSAAHDDHLHVRIACRPDEAVFGCEGGGPRWPWLDPFPRLAELPHDELVASLLGPIEGLGEREPPSAPSPSAVLAPWEAAASELP
jgi:glycerol-3-phosphate O-acyltransferase